MLASMAVPNDASGARYTLGSTWKHWRFGQLRSPPAILAMRRCCQNFLIKSHPVRTSVASLPMGRMALENATRRLPPAVPMLSFLRARMPSHGSPQGRCLRPKRGRQCAAIPGPHSVATVERIPSPKPCRNETSHRLLANDCRSVDALYETTRPIADGQGLRQAGCLDPNPHRRPQSLHGPWHTSHRGRRISPSGERGSPTLN